MKKYLKILAIVILVPVLVVVTYISYMQINYYRIEDNFKETIQNNQNEILEPNQEYDILTYNIGFGAYDKDYTFFLDSGVMKNGDIVKGKYSRAVSKDHVLNNINGSIETIKKFDPDIILAQEVDEVATRSYKVNQKEMFIENFSNMSNLFTSNFHTKYLFYPLNKPHGAVQSGMLTMSKFNTSSAVRRSYPISESFIGKFFDLDRSFSVNYLPVSNGKDLVIINNHMSAYDEGGAYREMQLSLLNEVMRKEYDKGNYVIVGGDYNHALLDTGDRFLGEQQLPSWLSYLDNDDLTANFEIVEPTNIDTVQTVRSAEIPYIKGINYETSVDGFIVSDNIEYEAINVDNAYLYSDHNPVYMKFILK